VSERAIVADEVLDGVVWKQPPEFSPELCGERLVGREDQRRPLQLFDRPAHDVGLAASGHSHQDLLLQAALDAAHDLVDRSRLIAGGRKWGVQDEAVGHAGEASILAVANACSRRYYRRR
jgi:hypothetical protein